LPRRLGRAQKERERVRRRCLQEFIPGSRVWIAFDLRYSTDGLTDALTPEEKKEHNWMWEEELGFTGVIRVQIGKDHGRCRNPAGEREELELIIGKEDIKTFDDLGISVLTHDQLNKAATFTIENCRKWDGKGKLLITVPPSRPVDALSIALFVLSLPSTAASYSPSSRQPPSYLSQMRLLPGILELKRSRELENRDPAIDADFGEFGRTRTCPNYTPMQLALWHIHDLTSIDESAGLKQEWRGALSLDGIERLEKLVVSG